MWPEVLDFRRCCFCVPLRYGLLIWGYLSLLYFILRIIINLVEWHYIVWHFLDLTWIEVTRFVLFLLSQLFTFGLTLLLIVASHKKDTKLFKIFYFYAIILALATFIMDVSDFVFEMIFSMFGWESVLLQALFPAIYVCLLLYVIALVRSEIRKLENSCKLQFTNIAVEANGDYYDKENSQSFEEISHTDRHTDTEHRVEIVISTENDVNNGLSK